MFVKLVEIVALFIALTVDPIFVLAQSPDDVESRPYSFANRRFSEQYQVGDPISAGSGAYTFDLPLLSLEGPLDLNFILHYRSDNANWSNRTPNDFPDPYYSRFWWAPNARAGLYGEETTFWLEDGSVVTFINGQLFETSVGASYSPNNGHPIRYGMKESAGYVYLLDPINEKVYIFDKSHEGRILHTLDRNGNVLTFSYAKDNHSNPSRISDNTGRELLFTYSNHGATGVDAWFLDRVTDQAGRSLTFRYDKGSDNNNNWTLRSIEDPMGNTYQFAYDFAVSGWMQFSDNIAQIVMPNGNIPYTNDYNAVPVNQSYAARVVSQKDAYGHTTTMAYAPGDNASYVVTTTYPDGSVNIYEHHSHHSLPKGYTDAAGNSVAVVKNASEQMTAITDRLGSSMQFTYHPETGKVASTTNPEGKTLSYVYTAQEQTFQNPANQETIAFTFYNQTQVQYPDGTMESYVHDGRGNVVEKTDQRGKKWKYEYNAMGLLTKAINPAGGQIVSTYNPDGTLASVADPGTGTITYGYDACKRFTTITNPDGTTRKFTYDSNDRVLSITDENTHTYQYEYDKNGNLTRIVDPAGGAYVYEYDLMDRIVRVTDTQGNAVSYTYNSMGLQASIQDANQVTTNLKYDPRRWISEITIANKTWKMTYDREGILQSSQSPTNRITQYQSDAMGRTTGIVDPRQQKTQLTYDAMGNLLTYKESENSAVAFRYGPTGLINSVSVESLGSVSYQYDDVGQLTQITDFTGNPWTFQYTAGGRLLSQQDPLGQKWTMAYDSRGRIASLSDPSGNQAAYTYDGVGNLTRLQYANGPNLSFAYNAKDQLISADRIQLTRDSEGRITKSKDQQVEFETGYDAGGRVTSVLYNNHFAVQYEYDAVSGFLKTVKDTLTETTLTFQTNAEGFVTSIDRSPGNVQTTYRYDDLDRLTRIQDGTFSDRQYTYDAAGNITQQLNLPPTVYPLPSGSQSWEYNAASEISTAAYDYDSLGRLTRSPQHTCTWDGASRLLQLDGATFQYNGLDGLIQRNENGSTLHYYYNYALPNAPLIAEQDEATGAFLRYYVWSPEGSLLYMIDAANGDKVYYYHFDQIGSTLALTDSQGVVTDSYAYTPYGVLLAHTGHNTQPFTYIGQWGVRQEGTQGILYQMGARYYDAASGRFLSRDPAWPNIQSPFEINPYAYAKMNPLLYRDPTGTNLLELLSLTVSTVGVAVGVGTGLIYDCSNFMKCISIRESHSKHLGFLKWPKKIAGWLELGHYVSGTSMAARLTGATALIWKILKVPVSITSKGVQVVGVAAQGSKIAPLFIKGVNVVGKVAVVGTLISGAISWAEVIDRTLFTSAAENSKMVGQESNSSNIFTRYSSLLGRWIGDLIYSRSDKLYGMTPEVREKFLQDEAAKSNEYWRRIREQNERHSSFGNLMHR